MTVNDTSERVDTARAPQLAGKAVRLRAELLLAQADGRSAEMRARLVNELTAVQNELTALRPADEQATDFDLSP